ncbi:MAG: PAS-domain containing protein [Alphaproteobacteria bacterium]|nr:PAS-domain containing protein [Alphaproteobacteria bacterium]
MQSWLVLAIALSYVGLLFLIAWHGDRVAGRAPVAALQRAPILYSLSLGVYCSSWTFYGSVGRATTDGFDFAPIYVGPILVFAFGWPLLARMVRIAKQQNTVSIADFIAARYGKSQAVAALVAIVAVIGVTPYLGLQLKAVANSFDVLTGNPGEPASFWSGTALFVAAFMALFAILFGVRDITASEHHPGLMRAIAFESIVKLVGALVVGGGVTFWLSPGLGEMLARAATDPALAHVLDLNLDRPAWWSATVLAGLAILCLPRQFHVTVVENKDEADLRRAAWLFPLYLVAINLFVVPVAIAGLIHFGPQGADADTYMVSLPVAMGASMLGLLGFIGGLSAATAMIIVASVALSTMVSNDVIMPLILRMQTRTDRPPPDRGALLLGIRRIAVGAILLLANGYHVLVGGAYSLASIGLVSFVAVAQFAPAMLGGLFWRGGTRIGALCGIGGGFALWLYTQVLPTFIDAGFLAPALLEHGPWGIAWLRPRALAGMTGVDPLTHGALWSLGVNLVLYVAGSLLSRPTVIEQRQAAAFIDSTPPVAYSARPLQGQTTIGDLLALAETYVGGERALEAFRRHLGAGTIDPVLATRADLASVRFTERLLAGAIGAASARVVVAGSLERKMLSRGDVMAVLDDASEAIRFNHEVLRATLENVTQGICVCDRDLGLVSWNQRFLELNDLPPSLVQVGTSMSAIVEYNAARNEYGEFESVAQRWLRTRGPDVYQRQRPDGTVLEVAINPMPEGGFVATYTDVTERHNAAAALREANESLERRVAERTTALAYAKAEAERANQSKTRFLAAASHDLLQPLHAARLFASALAERRREPLVDKIDASLRSVESLLGALLDVSKLDGGAVKPQVRAFPIDSVLATLEEEFTAIAREAGLALTVVRSREMVTSDPALLRRILQNFLSNAVRYTKTGRVLVGCRRRGPDLRLEVWDTGPGIPQESRETIFLEYHRLARDDGSEKGLGLGLAIVDRIAHMLEHPVDVRSTLGRGSMFAVTVPRAPRGAATPLPIRRRGAGFAGARVVCIDNDATILDGMAALLGGWDCRVIGAATAAGALAQLGGERPDALIVDYHLDGGTTGLAALAELQAALGGGVPGLVLTADHGDAARAAVAAAGYPLLTKPLRPGALRALLARLIQADPPRRAAR